MQSNWKYINNWATSWQNQQNDCAPSEDSDQPGHPPSLIRDFAVRSIGSLGPKLSSCGQRRLIRSGGCAGWSESSLGAHAILLVLSWSGSMMFCLLQVPTSMDAFMSYGPVVPDGYGVCYNPHPNNIVVCIAAFKSNAETQSDHFALTLESSLLQMQELCRKTSQNGTQESPAKVVRSGSRTKSVDSSRQPNKLVRQTREIDIVHANGSVATSRVDWLTKQKKWVRQWG